MSLRPKALESQIKRIISYLVKVGLSSDQNNPFIKEGRDSIIEITFPHAQSLSIALKNRSYSDIYYALLSERAFITKLPDGALITMRYLYVENTLQRHSLGFFPSPDLEEFQNNPEIYLEEAIYADVISRNIVPFPLRFDFDCRQDICQPILHPQSHLTLGQYKNCRIPVSAPLTPYHFTTFLLRNFYNTAFERYSDGLPYFKESFDSSIFSEEESLMHLKIPS